MRKFIKLTTLFSIPILIGLISLEILLTNIPNDYSYKRKYLDEKSDEIEVLFLGSSHIYFGVNPEYLAYKSFNGSHVSQSLNFDLAILEKYKDNWSNLKYIIIPIDYFSMYSTLRSGTEKWRAKNYSIYYSIRKDDSYWDRFELFSGEFTDKILRALEFIKNKKSDITCNEYGFGITYKSINSKNLIETGKAAAIRHTLDMKNNISLSENIQTVQFMIDLSKKINAKILFVTCPGYDSYRDNLNSNQLNNTINFIKQFSSKNSNVYYYNLLFDRSFVSQDFYDADHLNEIGAKKFTLKIDSIINVIKSSTAEQTSIKKEDFLSN